MKRDDIVQKLMSDFVLALASAKPSDSALQEQLRHAHAAIIDAVTGDHRILGIITAGTRGLTSQTTLKAGTPLAVAGQLKAAGPPYYVAVGGTGNMLLVTKPVINDAPRTDGVVLVGGVYVDNVDGSNDKRIKVVRNGFIISIP